MHVLTAAEMRNCDRLTAERFGLSSIELMRAASSAVADFVRRAFPDARRVTVLCGRGNNGGDGMMAARLLARSGLEVTALLLGSPDGLQGDAATAWGELAAPGAQSSRRPSIHVVLSEDELAQYSPALAADLIVDAVVGTGFKPPLKGLALAALAWIKTGSAPVLAVDLPSGWGADETGAVAEGPVFPADAVITFTAPKPAHLFGQLTRYWRQPVVVAPIGSPEAAVELALASSSPRRFWTGSAMELVQLPRAAAANKGNFGHVLVIGGSFGAAGGKAGAPAMTALAALRAGAGLVTAAIPAPAMAVVASVAPELMTHPLAATQSGCIASENLAPERLQELLVGKTVLAVGPGLGRSIETEEFLLALLAATEIPAVLDADALNLLASRPELTARLAEGRTLVLTPHPGEMARLAGLTVAEVQSDRLEAARSFAGRKGVTLVLKGARTLIAYPDGSVAVNTTGNPGMAKGGSGDLLTGLIAGLLAQHPEEPRRAVEAAVYLHGLAGDLAVLETDEHTLLATETLAYLPRAFRAQHCRFTDFHFHPSGLSGYLWLQGAPPQA